MISHHKRPRSYNIINEKGNTISLNRQHLIPINEKFDIKIELDDEIHEKKDVTEKTVELKQDIENTRIPERSYGNLRTRSGRTIRKPLRLIEE